MISVVGGAGFIGTQFCQLLFEQGVAFEILDLKPSRRFPDQSKIADIRSIDAVRRALSGDVIVHLAAVHRDDVRDPSLYAQTNIEGTRNLCHLADEIGVRKIIFTSSVAVYGFAQPGTDEAGAINPFNEYGRTKFAAEEVLREWQAADPAAKALIVMRPTVVFGEGNRGNVFNLLNQIASGRFLMVGSGTNRKSMAYIGNVAAFLQHALATECRYGVFNYVDDPDFDMNTLVSEVRVTLTGSGGVGPRLPYAAGLAIGHVADLVGRLTGRNLPLSAIRVKKFCGTTSFASAKGRLGGFVPPFSLGEGLRRTLEAEFLSPDPDREIFFTE